MRLLCPAKINLHLRVGPLRGDGFHPLLSWFCTTGLCDTLVLEDGGLPENAADGGSLISLKCDQPDLPCDRRNLVVKVAEGWGEEARRIEGARVRPVRARLSKRIPAGAGLGGGSSDGARTLAGLDSLWNVNRSANDLSAFAARFGSDLSFFFFAPSAICKGRGEIVEPAPRPRPRSALLALPPIVMPTGDVYRTFDAMRLGTLEDVNREPDWLTWSSLDASALLTRLVNDLEAPAFAISPELARLRRELEAALGRPVRMSGSGSSLFTVYDAAEESLRALSLLGERESFAGIRFEAVDLAPSLVDDLQSG